MKIKIGGQYCTSPVVSQFNDELLSNEREEIIGIDNSLLCMAHHKPAGLLLAANFALRVINKFDKEKNQNIKMLINQIQLCCQLAKEATNESKGNLQLNCLIFE